MVRMKLALLTRAVADVELHAAMAMRRYSRTGNRYLNRRSSASIAAAPALLERRTVWRLLFRHRLPALLAAPPRSSTDSNKGRDTDTRMATRIAVPRRIHRRAHDCDCDDDGAARRAVVPK